MKKLNIGLRSDEEVGHGHLSRMLIFLKSISIYFDEIVFISKSLDLNSIKKIKSNGYKYILVANYSDIEGFRKDWIILDDYSIQYEEMISICNSFKVVSFEDWPHRSHKCDIFVDYNYGSEMDKYKNFYIDCDVKLLGINYNIINESLKSLKKKKDSDKITNILVYLGSSDTTGINKRVLNWLCKSNKIGYLNVVFIVDKNKVLLGFTERNIKIYDLCDDLSCYYQWADIAIGSYGVSAIERVVIGLPSINILRDENQKNNREYLKENELCIDFDFDTNSFDDIFYDHDLIKRIKHNCFEFDALDRSNSIVKEMIRIDSLCIELLEASVDHCDEVYSWQTEDGIRRYFNVKDKPSYKEHCIWFEDYINSNNYIYIVKCWSKSVGFIRLNESSGEISILISGLYGGVGIGSKALYEFLKIGILNTYIAYIDEKNIASISAFKKNGFKKIGDRKYERSI